jgi:glycosyltransferase involved in cell wall biosynthesis
MKLLIVTGIFPPDIGGPATYVPTLAHALVERGHEVCVLTLSDYDDHQDGVYAYHVSRVVRGLFKPLRWVKTVAMVIRLGRSVDVFFACGLSMEAVLGNAFIRKPLVMRVVGDVAWERARARRECDEDFETFQKTRHSFRTRLVQWLQRWWILQADCVVTPSRYLARWVASNGVRDEKIVVIHNAVESHGCLEPMRSGLNTPITVATVGRLLSLKRVDGIIEVVARLEGVGLVVVGDGPEKPSLERLARELGVQGRVFFAGRLSNRESLRLMKSCDFLVLNSNHEGFPFVLLEAMSVGLPVIATAVGGVPEIVEHERNGLLVDPAADSLFECVKRLVDCPELRSDLANNARGVVKDRFPWLGVIDSIEELLLTRCREI